MATAEAPHSRFRAGSFDITHLSSSPEGFAFKTRHSIGRTEDLEQGLALSKQQKDQLSSSMKREQEFNNVSFVKEARETWLESKANPEATSHEIDALQEIFEQERTNYINRGKKVGLRAVRAEGNILTANVQLVPFPVYNEFANPHSSNELLKFSAAAGVAMITHTADERIIIQHRAIEKQKIKESGSTRGNALHADTPGASVAGMLDASLHDKNRTPGTPDPVMTESIKAAIYKEAGEELGISEDHLKNVRIVGLAKDNTKIHHEFLLLAETNLTAAELQEVSRTSTRNKNLDDADIEERFIDIEGTPQAIETLLSEVHCPLPPTHAAALVAAGYSLLLKEGGLEAATTWKNRLEIKVWNNYALMDFMVQRYYNRYPEMQHQVPERFWTKRIPSRNLVGYTPAYSPSEQGLPTFEDEMIRTSLLPETRRYVSDAYLLDVDSVLSDPKEKRVTEEMLFYQLINRLEAGQPVGFNSGRSTAWMIDRIITPLRQLIEDKHLLANMIAIGEKGGTWITFDEEGAMHHGKVEAILISDELKNHIKHLIAEKYADSMFFDETKETMITVEMQDGFDIQRFSEIQINFKNDLEQILTETGDDKKYRIDTTTIATDIESSYVGKALGADRFVEFLKNNNLKVDHVTTFGDSHSDKGMADELERRNQSVSFIFVGDETKLKTSDESYPIIRLPGYAQGTLAYLSKQ